MADPFTPDVQNPWFTDPNKVNGGTPGNTTGTDMYGNHVGDNANVGGVNGTVTSVGPDWLNHPAQHSFADLGLNLDQSGSWTGDQWREAATGAGTADYAPYLEQLRQKMGNDDLYHTRMNEYNASGQGYVPGNYDWTTDKMVYDNPDLATQADARMAAMGNKTTGDMTGHSNVGYATPANIGNPVLKNPDGSINYAGMASSNYFSNLTKDQQGAYNANNLGSTYRNNQIQNDAKNVLGPQWKTDAKGNPDWATMASPAFYASLSPAQKTQYDNAKMKEYFQDMAAGNTPKLDGVTPWSLKPGTPGAVDNPLAMSKQPGKTPSVAPTTTTSTTSGVGGIVGTPKPVVTQAPTGLRNLHRLYTT